MITNLASAVVKDLMKVALEGDYFEVSQSKRQQQIDVVLGGSYPKPLKQYIGAVSEKQFEQDVMALVPVFAENNSVITQVKRLTQEGNQLIGALLDSLSALRKVSGNSLLAEWMDRYRNAGAQYVHALDRELQQLLMMARGEDSPIVQIATNVAVDTTDLNGVPSVQVNRALIGGSRVFSNGTLHDDSWRARLTQVISVIS